MRGELLSMLRCPSCGSSSSLELDAAVEDEREVREGRLRCRICELDHPVHDGVADLMLNPSAAVRAEAEGLERFAEKMRQDGWDRAQVLSLPYHESGYWFTQACSMEHLLDTVPFAPGQRILDIGANTCWASATFARAGLRTVALDISHADDDHDYQPAHQRSVRERKAVARASRITDGLSRWDHSSA